jgi:hypothetical protein
MDYLTDYIKPELLVLIPVLYLIGMGLKKSQSVADRKIPLILGACGVLLAAVYVLASTPMGGWQAGMAALFTAVTQGVLCAGGSVYVHQLLKQQGKE